MQEVSYDPHKERQTERFLQSEEDRGMPLYQKLALGAAVGVGSLAIAHRSGAMHRFARFLDHEVGSTIQAFKETLDQEGAIRQDLSFARMRSFWSDMTEQRGRILEEKINQQGDWINQPDRDFDFMRYLEQRRVVAEQEIPYYIDNDLRFQEFLRRLEHHGLGQEDIHRIGSALEKEHESIIRDGNPEQIRLALDNEGLASFADDVNQIIGDLNQQHPANAFTADGTDGHLRVERVREQFLRESAEHLQTMVRPNGALKNLIVGHRQATVNDILQAHRNNQIQLQESRLQQIEEAIQYNSNLGNAIYDEHLYVDREGQFIDYKVFDRMKKSQMKWFSHTLPGGLLHTRDQLNIREAREQAGFRMFKRGTVQASLNAQMGIENKEPLHDSLIFMNGKFVRLFDENVANERGARFDILNKHRDMYLTSSKFGTIGKVHRQVSDLMTHDRQGWKDNWFFRTFDVGNQDKDATAPQLFSVFSKFFNPEWEANLFKKISNQGLERDDYFAAERYFRKYTPGFSARTLNRLTEHLPQDLQQFVADNQINFSRDEDMLRLFRELGEEQLRRHEDQLNHGPVQNQHLLDLYRRYVRNPNEVLNYKRPIGEQNPILGTDTHIQTGMDQIKQEVSLEILRQLDRQQGRIDPSESRQRMRGIFNDLYESGALLKKDKQTADWLVNYHTLREEGRTIYEIPDLTLSRLNTLFRGDGEEAKVFQSSLSDMVKDTNKWWDKFTGNPPHNQVRDEYIAMNKSTLRGDTWWEKTKDLATQMSWLTGRRNLQDFTTLSIFGSNYPVYRLQDALGNMGLGFSDDSLSSPLQMWSSLFLKRWAPLVGGYGAYQYADYEMDKHTGAGFSERYENYQARQKLEESIARQQMGTNEEAKRDMMLHPGIEQWGDFPELTLPFVGEIGLGHVLQNVFGSTMGFSPVDEKDTYTPEEYIDYLQKGTDEIRKGRWWMMGSKSAYRGDRISEFAPNEYRLAQSDWEYTNVTATGEEQYSHSFFPTLENPFGVLKQIFGGEEEKYWYEKKHYYDRPYLLTGELFNDKTMFFGDIGNMTLGKLIKPVREMHPDYWGDPVDMQAQTEDEGQRPLTPVRTRISPSGRIEHYVPATPPQYGTPVLSNGAPINVEALEHIDKEKKQYDQAGEPYPARYFVSKELDPQTNQETGGFVAQDMQTNQVIHVPARVAKEQRPMEEYFQVATGSWAPQETRPREMMQQAYPYQDAIAMQKYENVVDPRSAGWLAQEWTENWTEPLGVYKWIIGDELLGYNPYENKTVIAKADRAYNLSNQFWESDLGSIGGAVSEIGRRFLRREDGQLDFYNPIKNTMPSWMPGGNYMINFQSGDPYCVSPDTLIEVNGGTLVRADEVNTGDIIKTHKGVLRPVEAVKRREIKTNEKVYQFTVATLPAFPFTVSEEHPLLTVKDPANRRNYGHLKYTQLFEQANQIMDLLFEKGPLKKKDIHEATGIHLSRINVVVNHLVSDGRVIDEGKRKFVRIIYYKLYDIELFKRGIEWVEAQHVEIGNYLAYPLPENREEEIVLDMAEYLDSNKFMIFDDEIRYGWGTREYNEIRSYLEKNGVPSFKWGERKKFLKTMGWDEHLYENAQQSIKCGYKGFKFPRYLKIDKDLARLFGYWMAEGSADSNSISWAFHEKEEDYRREIDQALDSIIGKHAYTRPQDGKGVQHIIGCQPLASLLLKLFGNRANIKCLPDWWINLPNNVLIEFLRSLFNGDGSCFNSEGRDRVALRTTSKQLAYQVRLILLKLGIVASIGYDEGRTSINPKGNPINSGLSYHVNINSACARKLSDIFGYDLNSCEAEDLDHGTTWYMDDIYLYLRVNKKETMNKKDVPEVIGFQVGVDDSFCVAGVATHNTKVPHGEYRLPGEAYERLNPLHPDNTGSYGAFDKLKILADVAPWSDEYKFWRDYVTANETDEDLRKQAAEIKRQVADRKKKYEFYEYRFKGANLDYVDATVDRFLDDYTFTTKEFGDQPIRLAGVDVRPNAHGVLQSYIQAGDSIRIGINADPSKQVSDDTYKTMKAVVMTDLGNINRRILERGEMKENQTDFSAPAVWARFTPHEIAQGERWESLAHASTVVNTKLLQVRSAVEEYERDDIYGKQWGTWENFMISDYLIPGFQSTFRHDNPLASLTGGVFIGGLVGRIFGGGGKNTLWGAGLGGLISLGGWANAQYHEYRTGDRWIPERRRVEQDINEYFDMLKFMKYSGLYEKAKRESEALGYDVDSVTQYIDQKSEETKERRKALEDERRMLFVNQPSGWEDRRKEINAELKSIAEESWDDVILPESVLKTLQYKEEAETTLYGVDPYGDRMKVMRAMPYKDKWYFNAFAEAGIEDQKRILELVPEDQQRIYKAIWGQGLDAQKPLAQIFKEKNYYLPDANWIGWRPDVSLEDIKLNAVQREGLDLSDFNYWNDDVQNAQHVPALTEQGTNNIHSTPSNFVGYRQLQENLQGILEGQGLYDVQVTVQPTQGQTSVQINYEEDRRGEIQDHLKYNIESYL